MDHLLKTSSVNHETYQHLQHPVQHVFRGMHWGAWGGGWGGGVWSNQAHWFFFQDACRCLDQLPKGVGPISLRRSLLKLTLLMVHCPPRSEFAK